MREVEVLHDQLVDAFETDPTLDPRHVVVMTPDIEGYAPFVEAVFGAAAAQAAVRGGAVDRPRIPFRIADRRVRATHEVVDALDALLDSLVGRLSATPTVFQREEMSIAFSEDDGATWTDSQVIAKANPGAKPLVLDDGEEINMAGLSYPLLFERSPAEIWIPTTFPVPSTTVSSVSS